MYKIGIDVQTTLGQKTGFGYYVENLVKELQKIKDGVSYELIAPETKSDFSTPQRLIWDQFSLPKIAQEKKVDLLHQPAFSAPIFFSKPVVVTIHDLIAIKYGRDISFWSRQYFGRFMPFTYHFAAHIMASSEYTKKDIMEVLNVPEEKISVVYLALDHIVSSPIAKEDIAKTKKKFGIQEPFLLYVGTINPRKNLVFLTQIFERVLTKIPKMQLVIAGKKGWFYNELIAEVNKLKLDDKVIITDYITDEEKRALYAAADMLTFPSLYEGFGFPVLEAMACGVPVIASNKTSIPEVLGDAGISLNPGNKDEWADEIVKLHFSPERKRQLIAAGLKQAQKFSWEKSAKQAVEIYKNVLEAKK